MIPNGFLPIGYSSINFSNESVSKVNTLELLKLTIYRTFPDLDNTASSGLLCLPHYTPACMPVPP